MEGSRRPVRAVPLKKASKRLGGLDGGPVFMEIHTLLLLAPSACDGAKLRPRPSPFLLALAVFRAHAKAWKHAKCWCRQQFCVSGKCTKSVLTREASFADIRSGSST